MNITAEKFINIREEQKLFRTIAKATDKFAQVDQMLFQLLNLSGLRISEALNLKWADVGEDYLLIHSPKSGKKQETVVIGNKLQALLKAFFAANPYSFSEYVFNTQKGQYKRTNAHERLKYWLRVSELRDSISLHSFRHTYATRCLDAGLSLSVVRDQLRHSSVAVTSVYLHHTQETKNKLKEVF